MTPHLEKRWINPNGDLADEPQTPISLNHDLVVGLEKFARVFRPPRLDTMSILVEGWEDEVCTRWAWSWDPSSFVGGVAYRFAFGGNWSPWSVDHSYGYSPGHRPQSNGGISMKIRHYGVLFEVEVVLLGLCCMSRGPVTRLAGWIPERENVPRQQPALILNELVHMEE